MCRAAFFFICRLFFFRLRLILKLIYTYVSLPLQNIRRGKSEQTKLSLEIKC